MGGESAVDGITGEVVETAKEASAAQQVQQAGDANKRPGGPPLKAEALYDCKHYSIKSVTFRLIVVW